MIDFEELFDVFLERRGDRFLSDPRKFYKGKVFVASVDEDGPHLEIYDMQKFKEFVVILVQMFCEEKELSSFEEIKNHDAYEDFIESLIEGVYQL